MDLKHMEVLKSTTVICVKKDNIIVIGSDGQVSLGNTIIKGSANKVRKIYHEKVLVGFAGAAADAFTLLDKLEQYLETCQGDSLKSCVELAKEWRTDKMLRKLEAMLIVASQDGIFVISGNGDVLSPDQDVVAIGSGGSYAYSAGLALLQNAPHLSSLEIVEKSLSIAASICIYTNNHFSFEKLNLES